MQERRWSLQRIQTSIHGVFYLSEFSPGDQFYLFFNLLYVFEIMQSVTRRS